MKTSSKPTDYLEFANKGEVPVNAFKLLGASTKRNDSTKIGYFGTGLKYALAVFLREGIDFKIYSGEKEVKVGTRRTKFFDQTVSVITVNGEKTSVTVEAGINWEPWFAIREIYSNNLDENGQMSLATQIKPEKGTTKIYVGKNEKLKDLISDWPSYFSNTRTVLSAEKSARGRHYNVLQKTSKEGFTVFRKGIRAYYTRANASLFDYDVSALSINESRVAEHDWQARQRAAEALALCKDKKVINKFVNCAGRWMEKQADFWSYLFDEWGGGQFSQAWFDVLKDKRIVPQEYAGFYGVTGESVLLPEKLCKRLHNQFQNDLQIMGSTNNKYIATNQSTDFLEEAMQELEKVGFGYPMDKVKIVKFKDHDVLGEVESGTILISEKLATAAYEDEKLTTLFEEVAHAKSGYSDNTRSFQDYIIKITCSLIKAVQKPPKST